MKRAFSFVRSMYKQWRQLQVPPRFLTYIVTFSCNARCIMCDSWQKEPENELNFDEIDTIISQLPRMDGVRLSGGEPFTRHDLTQIAQCIQERLRPMFLHITTNGFLTKRIVQFCEERSKEIPLYLLLSIDGMKDKHNHVRGRDAAWDLTTRTLKTLAPRQKELRLKLLVNQTIVDVEGLEQYRELRDFLRPLGIHNNVVMAYDTSATYNLSREVNVAPTGIGEFTTFGNFSSQHLERLLSLVECDARDYPLLTRLGKQYYLNGIRHRLLNQEASPNPSCVALSSHLRIFPDGSVPTCQFNTGTIGNLREQRFEELWYSDALKTQRNWVRQCPGCWAECEVLPNAVYTGDLFKKALSL